MVKQPGMLEAAEPGQGFGFQGLGCGVEGLGFRVQDAALRE